MKEELIPKYIQYLRRFVTPERWERINRVLDQRTRYLTLVLEDIYQPHNASAVLRSCECFGIQDIHIVENKNEFDPNRGITIGADQWLSLYNYRDEGGNNTEQCYKRLRKEGYRIVATTPDNNNTLLSDLAVDRKTALVFGAELTGLSGYATANADVLVNIPIFGFSESYNISVSAALCLYQLTQRMREAETVDWHLTDSEKTYLKMEWLENSVRASDQLREKFLELMK